MNSTEAAGINVPRILDSIEFMIKMRANGIGLDSIGFRGDSSYQKLETESYPCANGIPSIKTEYIYNEHPIIHTYISSSKSSVMYCCAHNLGDISNIWGGGRANLISYDYRGKKWAIKVEKPGQHLTVTHKIEPGNITTDRIQDINDEAEIFQYSLTHPKIPDIVFEAARRMMELIQISPRVDTITMRMDSFDGNMVCLDLEEEFNRKQQGSLNF